jgi:hypothetical protein
MKTFVASISDEQLLMDAAGEPSKIWTSRSIRRNSLELRLAYLFTVTMLSGCIMAVVQTLDCLSGRN